MKISQLKIKKFRSIDNEITAKLQDYNCIVGKNDVGKSTILKAIDLFLNNKDLVIDNKNIYSNENDICMEFCFSCDI